MFYQVELTADEFRKQEKIQLKDGKERKKEKKKTHTQRKGRKYQRRLIER